MENEDSDKDPLSSLATENVEIVEAKTAVILLDSASVFKKHEYIHWRLASMFKPMAIGEKSKTMHALYLSNQRKHNWLAEYKNDDSTSIMMSAPSAPLASTLFPLNEPSPTHKKKYLYVITPRTNVITFTKVCRLVFMADLSSSLATVGNTKSQILLLEVFQTLRNALEGIVHPFCLQINANERIMIRPVLLLTVVADCSQFASNVNVIPILVNHPSMRVFIQNVRVTLDNVDHVISDLYDAFMLFQKDITIHRKQMKRKRSSMGYDLEVDEGPVPSYERSVFDATSLPACVDTGPQDRKLKRKPKPLASFVWGMGKTGGNLTRMLYAGAFALSLLPQHGRSQLILVTDGALKSHVYDNTVARQLAEQNVACHVIQIGFHQSFIPGRNFGFLPDVDTLKYLAQATGGTFLYSDECVRLNRPDHDPGNHRHFVQSSMMNKKGTSLDQDSSADESSASETDGWWNLDPNIYHRHFVLRESNLEKIRTLTPFHPRHLFHPRQADDTRLQGIMAMTNFPWDPQGTTPPIEWRLLRYREYALPDDFAPMVAARAREGFYLQSVLFDTKPDEKNKKKKQNSDETERIQITLVLYWKPHVIIEYRIRATWQPAMHWASVFTRATNPHVELFIRCDAEFAHMLQNWTSLRRRAQMMIMMGPREKNNPFFFKGEPQAAHAYANIEKLKTYLQWLFDSDELLKAMPTDVAKFRTFWETRLATEENRAWTRCWYDLDCIDMLVGDVSPYMDPKLAMNQDYGTHIQDTIQQSMMAVISLLKTSWANVVLTSKKQEDGDDEDMAPWLIKFIPNIMQEDAAECEFKAFCQLKVKHDYGRLIVLRFLFFNVDASMRQEIKTQVMVLLEENALSVPASRCNLTCARPLSRLLIRDEDHFKPDDLESTSSSEEDDSKKQSVQKKRPSSLHHQKSAWYLPVGLWLTGEHIVHDYLLHSIWSWQTDNYQDAYHRANKMMPVHDLAFQLLCQARLDQGYQLVLPRTDNTHFYQEMAFPQDAIYTHRTHSRHPPLCGIQYFIRKDNTNEQGRIITELWVEPSVHHQECQSDYEVIKTWTEVPDRRIISHLVTFDQIHAIGRTKGKGDFKPPEGQVVKEEECAHGMVKMLLPHLFDVSSILNAFVLVPYSIPQSLSGQLVAKQTTWQALFSNSDGNERLTLMPTYYCVLHYYFEQALERNVMDGQIIMAQHHPRREFWSTLKKAIQPDGNMDAVTSLRQMKCYVHIIDPRSFLIIMVPDLNYFMTVQAPRRFDCLLFECVRQKPLRATQATEPTKRKPHWLPSLLDDDQDTKVTMHPIDPVQATLSPFADFLPERVYCGHFQPPTTGSEQAQKFVYKVTASYAQAYLRAIYTLLLTHALEASIAQLPISDLVKALTICHTTVIHIDITRFVNILACPSITLREDMDEKWKMTLEPYFKPITLRQEDHIETADLLLYMPPTPPLGQHPFFLGFNITLGQTDDHMTALCEEPISFAQLKRTMIAFSDEKYEDEETFFAKAFPDDPTSPRLTLNLVCKSIDIDQGEEQAQIISQTVSKMEWTFTEQVLDGLLLLQKKQDETHREVLHYVVTQLSRSYPGAYQQQQTRLPLQFVSKDAAYCDKLFMDLFANDINQDDRVARVDPYFHLIWSPLTLLAASSENLDGLGITVEVPDAYWLIVAVDRCQVDIYYFALSDQVHPSTLVVDHTICHIRKVEKQTNQKILLDMLQESRICSKYLETPLADQGTKSSDSDSSHESQESTAFVAGEFQCPLVYRKTFPLHWRVPTGKALHYLKTDVLRPFTVLNRTDMYVIEREHTIVYCKLNETSHETSNELEMLVYGLECPDWIVHDVVTLIENRLTSEVTLEELQTFFTRNPTSKPTVSDVEFMLPFDKRAPQTEILCVPELVTNPSLLLAFFKRFLLAENLKQLKAPTVVAAITDAYHFDENQEPSDGIEFPKDDLCFYYNCNKRIPGVSSAFELACGQGMAGLCMTLRNKQGRCMTTLPHGPGFNFDPESIRQALETELRVVSIQSQDRCEYYVWVDVWTMGADDGILLQRIHDCYRRALCDYLIEETVTIDMASVLLYEATALQQAVHTATHRQLSTLLRKKFIQSIVYMLQTAVVWQNPTVASMESGEPWDMPPWCMKEILAHLENALVQCDPALAPTITWKKLEQDNDEWLLYRGGPVFCRNNSQNNIRVVAISGLREFVEQFGGAPGSPITHFSPIYAVTHRPPYRTYLRQPPKRRPSLKSDPSRRSSASTEGQISTRSRGSSTSYQHDDAVHPLHPAPDLAHRADPEKHCFLIMIMDVDRLVIYAYNWAEQLSARLFHSVFAMAHQQRMRAHVLDGILHQKMGLFHHSMPFETMAQNYLCSGDQDTSLVSPVKPNEPLKKAELQIVTQTSAADLSMQQVVAMELPPPRITTKHQPTSPSKLKKKRQRALSSMVDPLSMANPELNYVLMDAIADPVSNHNDLLRRHGTPYLDTYLQHATLVSVHQKALQVYSKWRKRFGRTIHTPLASPVEEGQDNLTRHEVSEILRSSRLLHFCRVPFFFFTAVDSPSHPDLADWYRNYLRTFVVDYSNYLEKLNLQVVHFAPNEVLLTSPVSISSSNADSFSTADLNTSKFDTGVDGLMVEHPSTYLLKVSEAGSILCEVRFTHTFVSVSLYGLHRGLFHLHANRHELPETKRRHFKTFEQGIGQLKHLIHINSFVYDFHLAYIQQWLGQGVPAGIGVMRALRRFHTFYTTPTHYATNRLFSGVYECKHHRTQPSVDLSHFFKYLYKDHALYGLDAVTESGAIQAVYLTSTSLTFDDDDSGWKYTLILCPMTEKTLRPDTLAQDPQETPASVTPRSVLIRYFILAVYQPDTSLVKNLGSSSCQLKVQARKKIDSIVSKVIKACKQRFSWRALLPTEDQLMDGYPLLCKFQSVSLRYDPMMRLVRMLEHQDILTTLLRLHPYCRRFSHKSIDHVLVYHPTYDMDALLHLTVVDQHIDINLVRREPRSSQELSPPEQALVASLGQSLCYLLWKTVK